MKLNDIEEFNGVSVDANEWMPKFEFKCEVDAEAYGGRTKEELIRYYLKGVAFRWYEDHILGRRMSWDQVRSQFIARFGHYRKETLDIVIARQDNLTLKEYIAEFKRKAAILGANTPAVTDCFVHGLTPGLKLYVMTSRPTSLEDAIELALKYENLVPTLISEAANLLLPNSNTVVLTGTGTVPLTIGDQQITLKNVFYAPTTQMNLVSITGLQKAGLTNVLFEETGLVTSTLSDSDSTIIIGHYDPFEKLYVLLNNDDTAHNSSGASIAPITARTRLTTVAMTLTEAHQSLGHLNHSTLLQAYRSNTLHGIKLTNLKWDGCASCDKCKGGETPIARQSTATYNEPGYICGDLMDFRVRDAHNFRYISSFIDISTRYCSIELLKCKDAHLTLAHFKRFVSFLQTQTGHAVKQLLTDNGREYDNGLFHSYCISQRISQRFTAPFTPAHNSYSLYLQVHFSKWSFSSMFTYRASLGPPYA